METYKGKTAPGSFLRMVISYLFAAFFSCFLFVLLQRSSQIAGGVREFILIVASVILSFALFAFAKRYLPVVIMFGAFLYISFFFRVGESIILTIPMRSAFSSRWILASLLVWFSGIGVLVLTRFFLSTEGLVFEEDEEFKLAFHLSSLLFIIIYILLLYYLFFLQREMDLTGDRRLNLIPFHGAFAVYWPHLISGHFGNDVFIQFFGNLLIFTPGGLLLGIYCKRLPLFVRLFIPVLLSGMIEGAQYYFNMGASDIDDFWMNVAGAWIGELLVFFLRKRRLSISQK